MGSHHRYPFKASNIDLLSRKGTKLEDVEHEAAAETIWVANPSKGTVFMSLMTLETFVRPHSKNKLSPHHPVNIVSRWKSAVVCCVE